MKVLFFTNIPSPYRVDFFNALGKLCDLTVLYERSDAKNRDASWLKKHEQANYRSVFLRGIKVGADTALCPGVIRYWKDKSFDIRIVGDYATPTGILSIAYMKRKRISYGIELDGGYVKEERAMISGIKKWLISESEFAFSPGRTTDRYLLKYGMSEDRIFRYPFTSLALEDLRKADKYKADKARYRTQLQIKEEKAVLSVGQLVHRKGFDILLDAARGIPGNVGIYIVGGKAPEKYLKTVCDHDLKQVHFIDFLPKWELAKYYAAADLFVLPTRDDVWGLVVAEAMSFSLPIVTTDKCVSGLELIKDRGGEIIPADAPDALAMAINRLLWNEERATQLGQTNRAAIEPYTVENMALQHMLAFEKIKESSRNGK